MKSSGYKTHASLDAFSRKFSDRILDKYLIYTKDLAKDEDIFCLPDILGAVSVKRISKVSTMYSAGVLLWSFWD